MICWNVFIATLASRDFAKCSILPILHDAAAAEPSEMNNSVKPGARFRLNQPPVIAEAIEGEVMVINLDSGAYYSVSGAGAVVWKALLEGATTAALVADASSRFDVDRAKLAGDVDQFVADLVTEGILVPVDDAGNGAPTEPPAESRSAPHDGKVRYDGLRFERYDDMRALLVVDPVHEVGEFGWPSRAGDDAPK